MANKKNNVVNHEIQNWIRPALQALCYQIAYKKIMGRFYSLRELPIAEDLKIILQSFKPDSYKVSLEKKYIDIEPKIKRKYLSRGGKKNESLDILLKPRNDKDLEYYIEIKRFTTSKNKKEHIDKDKVVTNKRGIETDIKKLERLLKLINNEKLKAKAFVLVVSQNEPPDFLLDEKTLHSNRKKMGIKKIDNIKYFNRITCKVISNVSRLLKDRNKEKNRIDSQKFYPV